VRLGEKCGMSSMHFSLRPALQADGKKITIRQALVNLTDWQTAMPEEKIFRETPIADDNYQRRATVQLEKGESGQNWPLGSRDRGGRVSSIYVQAEDCKGTSGGNLWRQGRQRRLQRWC
jgi:hypothetical protein